MELSLEPQKATKSTVAKGLTIVELLIVVVVIAILSSIVIISYNGITTQATESSIKSDIRNATSALEIYRIQNGQFPSSASAANDGKGISSSGENVVSYYRQSENEYCLTVSNAKLQTPWRVKNPGNIIEEGDCGFTVTTLAGSGSFGFVNGTGSAAVLASPVALTADPNNDVLYFSDSSTSRIRAVTIGGVVTTLAGNGSPGSTNGVGSAALFNWPQALTVGFDDYIYVADSNNHRIRKVPKGASATETFAGSSEGHTNGTGTAARFNVPRGIAFSPTNNILYVADSQNNRIRTVSASGLTTTIAGGEGGYIDHASGLSAKFSYPKGLAVGPNGWLYIADTNNHRIRIMTPSGSVSTLAGSTSGYQDGIGSAARFNAPAAVAVRSDGTVYVADTGNNRIRMITPDGTVTTVAGNGTAGFADGDGLSSSFNSPQGIAVGSDSKIYVSDTANHRIRKIE